jgi:hypothetical protein
MLKFFLVDGQVCEYLVRANTASEALGFALEKCKYTNCHKWDWSVDEYELQPGAYLIWDENNEYDPDWDGL